MHEYNYIYGRHVITQRLSTRPTSIQILYLQSSLSHNKAINTVLDKAKQHQIPVHYKTRDFLDTCTRSSKHQGIVAALKETADIVMRYKNINAFLEQLSEPAFLLVLDGVQDPHNLGACLRTACAMGVHAVIAPKDRAVGLTPVVRKVASGAAEILPFFQVTNLARVLKALKQQGIWLYGATEKGNQSLYNTNLAGSLAWVLGAEGRGLRQSTRKQCDYWIQIPTEPHFSTLNVSVATSICLSETRRQRSSQTRITS